MKMLLPMLLSSDLTLFIEYSGNEFTMLTSALSDIEVLFKNNSGQEVILEKNIHIIKMLQSLNKQR